MSGDFSNGSLGRLEDGLVQLERAVHGDHLPVRQALEQLDDRLAVAGDLDDARQNVGLGRDDLAQDVDRPLVEHLAGRRDSGEDHLDRLIGQPGEHGRDRLEVDERFVGHVFDVAKVDQLDPHFAVDRAEAHPAPVALLAQAQEELLSRQVAGRVCLAVDPLRNEGDERVHRVLLRRVAQQVDVAARRYVRDDRLLRERSHLSKHVD